MVVYYTLLMVNIDGYYLTIRIINIYHVLSNYQREKLAVARIR